MEGGPTPALARRAGLEGAAEASDPTAENPLPETGGSNFSARQLQRLLQEIGSAAQSWPARPAQGPEPDRKPGPRMSLRGDASGGPRRNAEREGRRGNPPAGGAQTRRAYLGGVFPQPQTEAAGHPVRDSESTPGGSPFGASDELGPRVRPEAIRRGRPLARQVVRRLDGAGGLANRGRDCFRTARQIADGYHALEPAGQVLGPRLGRKEPPADPSRPRRWAQPWLTDQGEKRLAQARRECAGQSPAEAVEKGLGYFVNNVARVQSGPFRRQGFFIGSGGRGWGPDGHRRPL